MKFEMPKVEIINLELDDIVTASCTDDDCRAER